MPSGVRSASRATTAALADGAARAATPRRSGAQLVRCGSSASRRGSGIASAERGAAGSGLGREDAVGSRDEIAAIAAAIATATRTRHAFTPRSAAPGRAAIFGRALTKPVARTIRSISAFGRGSSNADAAGRIPLR